MRKGNLLGRLPIISMGARDHALWPLMQKSAMYMGLPKTMDLSDLARIPMLLCAQFCLIVGHLVGRDLENRTFIFISIGIMWLNRDT